MLRARLEFPAIAGRDNHRKRPRAAQAERLIKLTVVAEEDIELMAEFGVVAMQKGRLIRLIEEAYTQDTILDSQRLAVLLLQTHRAQRAMLAGMWEQGVILPVAGMQKTSREKMLWLRGAVAVDRYLGGEDLTSIRKELAISISRWQRWWQGFKEVVRSKDQPLTQIQERLRQPPELIRAWLEVWDKHKEKSDLISRLDLDTSLVSPASGTSQQTFYECLRARHGYSPAAAEQFLDELRDLAFFLNRQERGWGAIIYHGVSDQEPAGKRLADCHLKAVVLDWLAPEDFELANRDNIGRLAWARLMRLATQARAQGAALSQPDLALLLGISTRAVQDLLKGHPEVVVPTRGLVADMGPALSHAEKIIRLYMDGYTETEIVRRTGHSYEAIETYLLDFARVVYLVEQGLPVPAIRQALGCSRKLVEKHVKLYREFSGPDYAFTMAKIRRLAEAHPVKKTNRRGTEAFGNQEGCHGPLCHPSCQGCTVGTNCSH